MDLNVLKIISKLPKEGDIVTNVENNKVIFNNGSEIPLENVISLSTGDKVRSLNYKKEGNVLIFSVDYYTPEDLYKTTGSLSGKIKWFVTKYKI